MNDTNLLMTVEHAQDMYRCEIGDLDARHRVPVVLNGAVLQTRRFTTARLAVDWAEAQRRAMPYV